MADFYCIANDGNVVIKVVGAVTNGNTGWINFTPEEATEAIAALINEVGTARVQRGS